MSANLYNVAFEELKAAANSSIRCGELSVLLTSLGFKIRSGGRGNHKVFTHAGLKGFFSGSFDCGHGVDPEVKKNYIRDIMRIFRTYEAELKEYLSGEQK